MLLCNIQMERAIFSRKESTLDLMMSEEQLMKPLFQDILEILENGGLAANEKMHLK